MGFQIKPGEPGPTVPAPSHTVTVTTTPAPTNATSTQTHAAPTQTQTAPAPTHTAQAPAPTRTAPAPAPTRTDPRSIFFFIRRAPPRRSPPQEEADASMLYRLRQAVGHKSTLTSQRRQPTPCMAHFPFGAPPPTSGIFGTSVPISGTSGLAFGATSSAPAFGAAFGTAAFGATSSSPTLGGGTSSAASSLFPTQTPLTANTYARQLI